MADPLMSWDSKQSRWRKMYRGKRLQIRATDLGGTTYKDTVVAANQWYRKQQTQIDSELAVETFRPHELEYRAILQGLQEKIKTLEMLMRDPGLKPVLAPKVEILKRREAGIKKVLPLSELPPLDDSLRDPLEISPERLEEEAALEAKQPYYLVLYATILRSIFWFLEDG